MKLVLLLLCSFQFFIAYSQNRIEITIEKKSKRTVSSIEVSGTFPNGDTAMRTQIAQKLKDNVFKRAKKGIYTIWVRYVLDKNGGISDVSCEKDPGYGMCGEALAAVLRSSRPVPGSVVPSRFPM